MAIAALVCPGLAIAEPLIVYAAASLSKPLAAIHEEMMEQGTFEVRTVLASSGALARQIERGAPADLFISANKAWMRHLINGGFIAEEDVSVVAGNSLVVIAPVGSAHATAEIETALDVTGRIAIGDPAHVPAGIYAVQALKALNLWSEAQHRLAPTAHVRAALALVERRAATRGIVYATDAKASDAVETVTHVPAAAHDPIEYLVARLSDKAAADHYVNALSDEAARRILLNAGFEALPATLKLR